MEAGQNLSARNKVKAAICNQPMRPGTLLSGKEVQNPGSGPLPLMVSAQKLSNGARKKTAFGGNGGDSD